MDNLRFRRRKRGRHEVLGGTLGVLVGVVVESRERPDLHHRKDLLAEETDGEFAALDHFLDKYLVAVQEAIGDGPIDRGGIMDEMHADTRSLARSLDHDRKRKRRSPPLPQDFGTGRRHPGTLERLLGEDLVKGDATLLRPLPRVGDAPSIEQGLEPAILPECPVDEVEDEFRTGRNFDIGAGQLDLGNLGPGGS